MLVCVCVLGGGNEQETKRKADTRLSLTEAKGSFGTCLALRHGACIMFVGVSGV